MTSRKEQGPRHKSPTHRPRCCYRQRSTSASRPAQRPRYPRQLKAVVRSLKSPSKVYLHHYKVNIHWLGAENIFRILILPPSSALFFEEVAGGGSTLRSSPARRHTVALHGDEGLPGRVDLGGAHQVQITLAAETGITPAEHLVPQPSEGRRKKCLTHWFSDCFSLFAPAPANGGAGPVSIHPSTNPAVATATATTPHVSRPVTQRRTLTSVAGSRVCEDSSAPKRFRINSKTSECKYREVSARLNQAKSEATVQWSHHLQVQTAQNRARSRSHSPRRSRCKGP